MYASKHAAQSKNDQELVALTLKDNLWYQYLMERYEKKLMRYIRRICFINEEEAEDILQEVWIKAYQHLNDFNTDLSFSSWIYKITHNQSVSYLRKLNVRPKTFYPDPESSLFGSFSGDMNIQQKIDKKYFKKNIMHLLNTLDEKYRTVLILKYLENKNYQEISDILKKPMGTVATLLNRAKKKLKVKIIKNKIL